MESKLPPRPPAPPDTPVPPAENPVRASAVRPLHFASNTYFQAQLGVESAETAEETILADLLQNRYFRINSTGAYIWHRAKSHASFGEIVETVSSVYTMDQAAAAEIIAGFLAELSREGLLIASTQGVQVYRSE